MAGLERTSHRQAARPAEAGRMRHGAHESLPRHRHDEAFAAVVLRGGYVEAGDTGRHRTEPGDVILHRALEHHLDRFDGRGAEVLVLPLDLAWAGPAQGRVADPDVIVRLAETDPRQASRTLLDSLAAHASVAADWPDILALALRDDPALRLARWSRDMGLHPGSVSRGFRQVFGVTPAAYRLAQRTQRAVKMLLGTPLPLSHVAQDCGFTDQAHMTRAVVKTAGVTPGTLRRRVGA